MQTPSDEQIIAGRVARDAIKLGMSMCARSVTGVQLDRRLEEFIRDNGCVPSLKGYKPPFTDRIYQHTICLARNNEAVHGVPKEEAIDTDNDLITIDLVVERNGWHADTARTFTNSSEPAKKAIVSKIITLHTHALTIITPNAAINTYADFCNKVAQSICDVTIVKEFCGHGIGRKIHEAPQIPCVPTHHNTASFELGKTYAVEPVIAMKKNYVLSNGSDGWSVSADCLTAHMEDTIFISAYGILNLTN